jgi:predicted oxidoreductase
MNSLPLKTYFPNASDLVYGCMALGGGWDDSPVDAAAIDHAHKAISTAVDAGITVFDQADIYQFGKSEQVMGEVFSQDPSLRENIILQSKCGIRFEDEHGPKRYDSSKSWIIQSVHQSLKRLKTDYLDVLLIHRPDPLMETEEVAEAFSELLEQGKVKHFGVSNMHGAQMRKLSRALPMPLVVNQVEMSLTNLGWLEEGVFAGNPQGNHVNFTAGTLEYAEEHGIQIQAWGSLSQGKYSGDPAKLNEQELQTYRLVQTLAEKYSVPAESLILGWLMRHPNAVQPVIGTANPSRIKACSQAPNVKLSREDWYALYASARQAELP